MLTIFAGISQFERECTLQHQTEGIAIAKAEGKYKGRKPIEKPADWDYAIGLYKAKELTAAQAQKRLGLSHATFYREAFVYRWTTTRLKQKWSQNDR